MSSYAWCVWGAKHGVARSRGTYSIQLCHFASSNTHTPHHVQELVELHGPAVIRVHLCNHVADLVAGDSLSECLKYIAEFLVGDIAVAVGVKLVKVLAEARFFLGREGDRLPVALGGHGVCVSVCARDAGGSGGWPRLCLETLGCESDLPLACQAVFPRLVVLSAEKNWLVLQCGRGFSVLVDAVKCGYNGGRLTCIVGYSLLMSWPLALPRSPRSLITLSPRHAGPPQQDQQQYTARHHWRVYLL